MAAKKKRNSLPIGKCFDHLGGYLAPVLFNKLLQTDWIKPKEGRKTILKANIKGVKNFEEVFDIDISKL